MKHTFGSRERQKGWKPVKVKLNMVPGQTRAPSCWGLAEAVETLFTTGSLDGWNGVGGLGHFPTDFYSPRLPWS